MDVAKYIGLFLLKNNSCHIHGLSTIELKVSPATYDGRNLVPGIYEIVIADGAMADDSLPNFIATNEQVSISKATTAVREFSTAAKAKLIEGKEVAIPSLGHFFEINNKLQFATAPYLQNILPPIPAEKGLPRRADNNQTSPTPGYINQSSKHTTSTPPSSTFSPPVSYELPDAPERKQLNWGRIAIFILLLLALIAGLVFAMKNMMNPGGDTYMQDTVKPVLPVPDTVASQMPVDSAAIITDTSSATLPATAPVSNPAAKGPLVSFKVILNNYPKREKAQTRLERLKSYGNNVELIAEDSNLYYIVMPITAPAASKAKIMDSLRRTFNPDGVFEY